MIGYSRPLNNTHEMGLYQSISGDCFEIQSTHTFKPFRATRYCWAWILKNQQDIPEAFLEPN